MTTWTERSSPPSTSWTEREGVGPTSWDERTAAPSTTFLEGPYYAQQQSPFYMLVRGTVGDRKEPSADSNGFCRMSSFPGTHFMGKAENKFIYIAEK